MSQHDDLFQELGRTLDVAPSGDFADGVRSRIVRRRLVIRTTMSGLAIAASILLVVIANRPWASERSPRALALGTVAGAEAPALHQDPDSAVHARAERSPRASSFGHAQDALSASRRAALGTAAGAEAPATPTAAADTDPLRVVTNQMAVLRAVWADQQVTAGESEAPVVEALPTTGPAPVVVEPVRVLPVVIVDNRASTEGLPIIRRAVAALETK